MFGIIDMSPWQPLAATPVRPTPQAKYKRLTNLLCLRLVLRFYPDYKQCSNYRKYVATIIFGPGRGRLHAQGAAVNNSKLSLLRFKAHDKFHISVCFDLLLGMCILRNPATSNDKTYLLEKIIMKFKIATTKCISQLGIEMSTKFMMSGPLK